VGHAAHIAIEDVEVDQDRWCVEWRYAVHQRAPMRGSNASRSPSPTWLAHNTVMAIARPGGVHSHGCLSSTVNDCAEFIMPPQLGTGICTPSPRKLSAASVRMACASASAPYTAKYGRTPGRTWRTMMRGPGAPSALAASTNCCWR